MVQAIVLVAESPKRRCWRAHQWCRRRGRWQAGWWRRRRDLQTRHIGEVRDEQNASAESKALYGHASAEYEEQGEPLTGGGLDTGAGGGGDDTLGGGGEEAACKQPAAEAAPGHLDIAAQMQ